MIERDSSTYRVWIKRFLVCWIGWLVLWAILAAAKPEWSILLVGEDLESGVSWLKAVIRGCLMGVSIALCAIELRSKVFAAGPAIGCHARFQMYKFYFSDLLNHSESSVLSKTGISSWLGSYAADPVYGVLGFAFFVFLLWNVWFGLFGYLKLQNREGEGALSC